MSGGLKHRLIADFREIKKHLEIRHFKLDHWQHIFPLLRKKTCGGEGRFQACLFPFGNMRPIETFHQDVGGAGTFSVPSGLFWTGNFTTTVDEPNEGSRKVPKITMIAPVHLLARHFVGGSKQKGWWRGKLFYYWTL